MYICYEYYISSFGGTTVPENEFDALCRAASTIVDLLVSKPICTVSKIIKDAVAYQVDTLYIQGGVDALSGFASIASGIDEKVGDFSLGTPYVSNEKRIYSMGGVPISGMTLSLLRKANLMGRCIYEEV